jgi:molybdenum cofactor cytidylyltransferase
MGQPKLLLPWGRNSILGHLCQLWATAGARQIAVVCAPGDASIRAEAVRLGFPSGNLIENPTPEIGMFSSVQCGVRWPDWGQEISHWAIVLGDQPHLRLDTLTRLLGFAGKNPDQVCQPSYHGRLAHPVILPKALFGMLGTAKVNTLKEFLAAHEVARFISEDAGLALDIDRPEDYLEALALAGLQDRRA